MAGMSLERPRAAMLWELRTAWASGRRTSVTLDIDSCPRLEGIVEHVAASDTFVMIAGRHIPVDRILGVHWPSRLGDSTLGARPTPRRRRRLPTMLAGQIRLFDPTAGLP